MASDDPHYTFNPLSNEDKELLLRHGYVPGELPSEDERELLADLRSDAGDNDSDRRSDDIPADERDGT